MSSLRATRVDDRIFIVNHNVLPFEGSETVGEIPKSQKSQASRKTLKVEKSSPSIQRPCERIEQVGEEKFQTHLRSDARWESLQIINQKLFRKLLARSHSHITSFPEKVNLYSMQPVDLGDIVPMHRIY